MFKILLNNLIGLDGVIIILAFVNGYILYLCKKNADSVYDHFNKKDYTANLTDEQKEAFMTEHAAEDTLTPQDLLKYREKTNRLYALFTNFTSVFPLLGMFGTVISLLRMGELIGSEVQGAFFTALTSTFWGIFAAIIFKMLDSAVSYRIDDNEKHLEYLFNPKKGEIS
ncbi:MAG: MotA/TolQ/ExbB proton channel family protein [Solobacterium sp.]|nr:MotA/TolQ/ExbB proton channel family protein [Solobacterium sp.]